MSKRVGGGASSEPRTYAVGQLLRHHAGDLWKVIEADLPGDGSWGTGEDAGMVVLAGDYRIECIAGREHGRTTRVHADYIPGSFQVVEQQSGTEGREREDAWRWVVFACGHGHHFKVDAVEVQARALRPGGPYCPVCGTSTVTRLSKAPVPESPEHQPDDEGCACCGATIARPNGDPWEGRLDAYCEECATVRCDAFPGECRKTFDTVHCPRTVAAVVQLLKERGIHEAVRVIESHPRFKAAEGRTER